MPMEWIFQGLVLVSTALFWWLARRDLTSKAAESRAPAMEDWERLRVTVEQLTVELERRAVVAEQRVYEAEVRLREADQRLQSTLGRATAPRPPVEAPPAAPVPETPAKVQVPAASPLTAPLLMPAPVPAQASSSAPLTLTPASEPRPEVSAPAAVPPPDMLLPEDDQYAPIHALMDAGVTDAAEIARRTGLPRGEVDLVLGLRARRT